MRTHKPGKLGSAELRLLEVLRGADSGALISPEELRVASRQQQIKRTLRSLEDKRLIVRRTGMHGEELIGLAAGGEEQVDVREVEGSLDLLAEYEELVEQRADIQRRLDEVREWLREHLGH